MELCEHRPMLLSFVYLAFVSLLKLLVRSRRPERVKDIEILVLRHQLEVMRRGVERPRVRPADRALLVCAVRKHDQGLQSAFALWVRKLGRALKPGVLRRDRVYARLRATGV